MRRIAAVMGLVLVVAMAVVSFTRVAHADETKMVGVITRINIDGKDAKTATVVLKDNKSGELVTIIVNDNLTLDKFKDHRIVEGDEIRAKFDAKDGRNASKSFKKTAGC